MTTDTARFSSSPFSCVVLLSVSQYHIDDRHGSSAAKKLIKSRLETFCLKNMQRKTCEKQPLDARVDQKRVRDWRKNQTELQRLSEEDSNRTRLLLEGGRRLERSFR